MAQRRMSRRGFLRSAGGAAVAAPLVSALPLTAATQVPNIDLPGLPGDRLGWAVVGLGRLAIFQILPGFAKAQHGQLKGLVSGTPDKAAHIAQLHGVDSKHVYSYERYDEIANDPAIDVVYVALPNSMHEEYTVRALEAGKHVLCEKPMAKSPEECERMIAAANANDRKLMIAYRLRYEPFNQELIKFAQDDSETGPTRIIEASAGFSIGDPNQWRLKRAMSGGGSLMDIGIYALQAARYTSGEEPVEVSAMMDSAPGDPRFAEVEENITFQLRFPSGVLANCSSSYGAGMNRFRVSKPGGWAELEPALSYTGLRMRVQSRDTISERSLRPADHFAAEMDHFSQSIRNATRPLTPGEEGLRDSRIMAGIYEAARSGKTIALPAPAS